MNRTIKPKAVAIAERFEVSGIWRALHGNGVERFSLERVSSGWTFTGVIARIHGEIPVVARYMLRCTDEWRTRNLTVHVLGPAKKQLTVENREGAWFIGGKRDPRFDGCVDVDLQWSPSTNTLPISRLNLAVGESSGKLTAVWVRFPELTVELLPQEYERLSGRTYRYASPGFSAEMTVDTHQLVEEYVGQWQRVLLSQPD